jgi:hypothetical protein
VAVLSAAACEGIEERPARTQTASPHAAAVTIFFISFFMSPVMVSPPDGRDAA